MRFPSYLAVGLLTAGLALAQGDVPVGKADPNKAAVPYNGPRSNVSMFIWSDKYTYQAGQALTLRWTVNTNGDLYPYTVFAYRQNNQTGAKTYLPGGTTAVTDAFGNTAAQGYRANALVNASKAVVLGTGGLFPAATIPDELGMHTIVIELRDYAASRVLKTAYQKIGVVKGTTTITGEITSDRTLTNDTLWNLSGIVFVKNNATLTIEPGTFVIGQAGSTPSSALIVTQSGKINASGTKSRPIIMTSAQPFGQRARGDWGGVAMLGKAPINVAANTQGGICPATGCNNATGTFFLEGLVGNPDTLYGGADPNHSCGVMRYVRVEYAGAILSPNNELNSFTWGGCGKGTVAEHLQAIYGKDDSFEWFGGNMDAKWLVGGLGADDFIDYQLGYTGRIQFGLMYQSPDAPGNRGIEGDNSEYNQAATPFSNPQIYNVTFYGSGSPGFDEANSPGIFLRRGARSSINNILVSNFFSSCIDINDAATQAQATADNIGMNGILCYNNNKGASPAGANTVAGQNPAAFNATFAGLASRNFLFSDPLVARAFTYSDPDFSGLFASPLFRAGAVTPPDDGFFDQSAQFIGGIGDDDWTLEWTSWLVEEDIKP